VSPSFGLWVFLGDRSSWNNAYAVDVICSYLNPYDHAYNIPFAPDGTNAAISGQYRCRPCKTPTSADRPTRSCQRHQICRPNKIGTKGIIQAWNIKTGKKLWEKTLYTVRINPKLETDVQWLYIQSIQIKGNQIIATNEQNQRYSINLKPLQSKHFNP
jgi:hypothetical protein